MAIARFPALSSGPPGLLRALASTAVQRPTGTVTALVFDQGKLVLAAAGIWTSVDGGANFLPRSEGPGSAVAAVATHPDLAGVIYAATANGLQQSVDAGLSWHPTGSGLPATPLEAVAIAAHDPQIVYVAVRGDGLWQSKDGAKSWDFAMDRPLVDKVEVDVQAIASVGSLSGMGGYWVYAGTSKGVSKVPDCFCRWQPLENTGAMDNLAKGAKPAPIDPALRLPHLSATSLVTAPSAPEVLFAGLPSGIWKTADSGATWILVSTKLSAPLLAINPQDPNNIVACDAAGTILCSRDGGVTWAAPAAV
jgi:photosystem II stability/assembly factor-like uncharacterized protein